MDSLDTSLTAEDENSLAEDRIVVQNLSGGKRKVSASLLIPPSSHAGSLSSNYSSSSSSSATASFRFQPLTAVNNTIILPDHSESVAAIEFCGFTLDAAQQIYSRFVSRTDPNSPDELLDYMKSETNRAKDEDELLPRVAMSKMGLGPAIQDRIMDDRFEQIRQTQSITAWVRNTIEVNYETLLLLQQRLKAAAVYTRAKKKRKSVQHPETFQPETVWQPSGTATVTSNIPGLSACHNLPEAHVSAVAVRPVDRPDHYTLYRGKAAVEMGDWISSDGSLQLEGLRTYAKGDFNLNNPAYYWTLELETAERYCNYAATRCPYSEIWLLQVQVKKTFVDSLRSKDLWYSNEWKEFVWHCRKGLQPPPRYDDFWKTNGAELIKGHVCQNSSRIITNIKKEDVQTAISEANVLSPNNQFKATQWCFLGIEVMSRFDAEVKGKIHVEIRPPPDSEMAVGKH
ncbi:MAG: hypothetical protein L6R42_008152 [Xanthoria sp. 1 TBL-2021]|nr:MAG: hypothetical protein L6R42_008152 [Xanthoria sp. 1 TBL-2021]